MCMLHHAGAVAVYDALVNASDTILTRNRAGSGGAALVSHHAAVALHGVAFTNNSAVAAGGAVMFAGIPDGAALRSTYLPPHATPQQQPQGRGVSWSSVASVDNRAVSGGGIFWQLPLPHTGGADLPTRLCEGCVFARNTGGDVATSAVTIGLLPVHAPVTSASVASGVSVRDQLGPNDRPRAAILDVFNNSVMLDSMTVCSVALFSQKDASAVVAPRSVRSDSGALSFAGLTFLANVDASLVMETTCVLASPLGGSVRAATSVAINMEACRPGWDQSSQRVCRRCLLGFYSPAGKVCLPCPDGRVCTRTIVEDGNEVRWCLCCALSAAHVQR